MWLLSAEVFSVAVAVVIAADVDDSVWLRQSRGYSSGRYRVEQRMNHSMVSTRMFASKRVVDRHRTEK